MSIINRIILLLFICLLYSCDNENMPFVLEYAKLGDATDITQTSVTLSAEVFPENSSFDEVYFVIEDSLKMFDAIKENCSMSTTGKYSINLKNLISGMTYSYYFVIKSFSSEKKKFTTLRDDNMPYIPYRCRPRRREPVLRRIARQGRCLPVSRWRRSPRRPQCRSISARRV